jgi:hypothetical protein
MVGRSTRLHADQTGRQRLKEGKQLRPLYGPMEDDPTILRNAVNLKNILGQIKAYCLNCHWVASFLAVIDNCTLAHSMPVEQEPPTSSAMGR